MKRVTALLLAAMMIITTGLITPAMAAEDDVPETYSNAYVVMDAKTGQVLLQKNMYEKEYPASITKILTTALGLTYAKPEDRITVSQETVSDVWKWGETTHLALEPGEIITLKDALYGALNIRCLNLRSFPKAIFLEVKRRSGRKRRPMKDGKSMISMN